MTFEFDKITRDEKKTNFEQYFWHKPKVCNAINCPLFSVNFITSFIVFLLSNRNTNYACNKREN